MAGPVAHAPVLHRPAAPDGTVHVRTDPGDLRFYDPSTGLAMVARPTP